MTRSRSFRFRVVIGSVLWTLGLLGVAHMLSLVLMAHVRSFRLIGHGWAVFIALVLMIAGIWQLRTALSPLQGLRRRLSALRDGSERRIDGTYPTEVQPLVNDLNALLDHRDEAVRCALAKAGDLAHGLKTPLAVLAQEAERAEAAGQMEVAAAITEQVDRMRRQIDYNLAHARAAASGATAGARSSIRDSADGLTRSLLRLYAERGVAIDVDVSPEHAFRGQREDLDEILGNVLDNACNWAHSRVAITSTISDGRIAITIDDDGPGLDPSMRERVLQRGVRADEAARGSGLGLAIVCDLAGLYGGTVALDSSPIGGLRVRLELPGS